MDLFGVSIANVVHLPTPSTDTPFTCGHIPSNPFGIPGVNSLLEHIYSYIGQYFFVFFSGHTNCTSCQDFLEAAVSLGHVFLPHTITHNYAPSPLGITRR